MKKLVLAVLWCCGFVAAPLSAKKTPVSFSELKRHCANHVYYSQTGETPVTLTCKKKKVTYAQEGTEKFPLQQGSGVSAILSVKGGRAKTDWLDVGGIESVAYGSCPIMGEWEQSLSLPVPLRCQDILAAESQQDLCELHTKADWDRCSRNFEEAVTQSGKSGKELELPTTDRCEYQRIRTLSCGGEPEPVAKPGQKQASDDDFGAPVQVDATGQIDPNSVGADLKMATCFRKLTDSATSARIMPRSCVQIRSTPAEGSLLGVINEGGRTLQNGDCVFRINGERIPSRKRLKQALSDARNAEDAGKREVFIEYHAKGNLKKDPNFIDFKYGI